MGGTWNPIPALPWLRILPIINTGTACGYLPQFGMVFTFAPFLILAIVIIFYRSQPRPSWLLTVAVGLIIGGAFGNLVDRLRFGYVVDFVQVGAFPIFNVADASVSTAVVIMLLWSLREDASQARRVPAGAVTPGGDSVSGELAAALPGSADSSGSSWKLAALFLAVLGVVAALGYFVCVIVPSNFLK